MKINFDQTQQIKRFDFGLSELIDSTSWRSDARAHVLVVCPHRDITIRKIPYLGVANRVVFPQTDSFLHPAQVRCFIRVKYELISKAYAASNLQAKSDYYLHSEASGYTIKEAVFAVCDFFHGHRRRNEWSFAPLAELWDQEFYKYSNDFEIRAKHLVPLNRIAGKYIPGLFTPDEFPGELDSDLHPQNGTPKFRTPMVVMKLPQRL